MAVRPKPAKRLPTLKAVPRTVTRFATGRRKNGQSGGAAQGPTLTVWTARTKSSPASSTASARAPGTVRARKSV